MSHGGGEFLASPIGLRLESPVRPLGHGLVGYKEWRLHQTRHARTCLSRFCRPGILPRRAALRGDKLASQGVASRSLPLQESWTTPSKILWIGGAAQVPLLPLAPPVSIGNREEGGSKQTSGRQAACTWGLASHVLAKIRSTTRTRAGAQSGRHQLPMATNAIPEAGVGVGDAPRALISDWKLGHCIFALTGILAWSHQAHHPPKGAGKAKISCDNVSSGSETRLLPYRAILFATSQVKWQKKKKRSSQNT